MEERLERLRRMVTTILEDRSKKWEKVVNKEWVLGYIMGNLEMDLPHWRIIPMRDLTPVIMKHWAEVRNRKTIY